MNNTVDLKDGLMNLISFDTYDFFKKLKDVGFSEKQAETLIDLQKVTLSVLKAELAKFKLKRDGEILFLVRHTKDGYFLQKAYMKIFIHKPKI